MTKPAETVITAADLTTEQRDSTEPSYLLWKKDKIESALRHAEEHPDDFLTEEEVWKRFGLDY